MINIKINLDLMENKIILIWTIFYPWAILLTISEEGRVFIGRAARVALYATCCCSNAVS
jgi:hypothetical protein